ncbi:IS4 family transposase [Yeosuana sp.]|uniref:IS4 family transposase n=1 Tax=Yeosuana sp. TaxID=2529388 RepID=UPI004054F44D|tara:strand:- start:48 stop:1367 length:1320 start_codon:yes stop_codon:yes gene_type:complete
MNGLFISRDSCIRRSSDNAAQQKAAYRFLDNEKVTEQELIEVCCERTKVLCKDKHVLVLNDTSEINLQRHVGRLKPDEGVGLVGNNKDVGFFAHLGLVVDIEADQAIGYSSINLWHREMDKGTKPGRECNNLPIEGKESYKWIKCCNESKEVLKDAASITVVGDRESDIYELFIDAKSQGIEVLARNKADRKTEEGRKLYGILNGTEVCGSYKIEVLADKRKQRQKREAVLNVKFSEVHIKKPNGKKDERPAYVKAWIVEARENDKKDGICWRLLTTHSIENFEQAVQIVEWYQRRWFVEQVFRLLKNKGYRIENSELGTGWALRKLTVLLLQNVLRVIQMLIAYNGTSEKEDAGLVFTETEIECLTKLNIRNQGKTKKLRNPYNCHSLKWATWIIARLGGWSGYRSQRPPGPITLKNGLEKFNHVLMGWEMAKDVGTR